jgi:hypothetical protein
MSGQDNLIRIFEYALNQEYTGKSFFETSLARMGLGSAKSAFRKLVAEEEKHIAFITRVLDDLKQGREFDLGTMGTLTMDATNYFDERAKSEFLEQCLMGSMVPDVTVFNVAWLIEKDLAEFYANAARRTEGAPSEALGMLSVWEKAHEKFFREYRDKLSEVYSTMPWGG